MLSTKKTYVKYSKNVLQRKALLDIFNNVQMEFVVKRLVIMLHLFASIFKLLS